MKVMETEELFTEISVFLRVTLRKEKLTHHAEDCRKQLIKKLTMRHHVSSLPVEPARTSYMPMNIGHSHAETSANGDTYEVFINDKELLVKPSNDDSQYNNVPSNQQIYHNDCEINQNEADDNAYIIPTSMMANLPVGELIKISLPTRTSHSNSSSGRNSVVEKTIDSESLSSTSTKYDEYPEVCDISASALRVAAAKCGPLGRRGKMFIIGHTKTYWAAVHQNVLYLFTSDKDLKPVVKLDLTGYTARPVIIPGGIKNDFRFELVAPGKRTHQFITEKHSDMFGWIDAVNSERVMCCRDEQDENERTPLPVEESEQMYDIPSIDSTSGSQRESLSQDKRYVTLPVKPDMARSSSTTRLLPLLPAKQTRKLYSFPKTPARPVESPESHAAPLYNEFDNFSDDENIYMTPNTTAWQEEEIYDFIKDDPLPLQTQKATTGSTRELPCLPHEMSTYDRPDSTVRPVKPITPEPPEPRQLYYNVGGAVGADDDQPFPDPPEEVYSNIEENIGKVPNDTGETYYNLPSNMNSSPSVVNSASSKEAEPSKEPRKQFAYLNIKEIKRNEDDNETYNNSEKDRDQEQLYDVISETRPNKSPASNAKTPIKPIFCSMNFFSELNQKMEERERRNSSANFAAKSQFKAPVKKVLMNKGYQ